MIPLCKLLRKRWAFLNLKISIQQSSEKKYQEQKFLNRSLTRLEKISLMQSGPQTESFGLPILSIFTFPNFSVFEYFLDLFF